MLLEENYFPAIIMSSFLSQLFSCSISISLSHMVYLFIPRELVDFSMFIFIYFLSPFVAASLHVFQGVYERRSGSELQVRRITIDRWIPVLELTGDGCTQAKERKSRQKNTKDMSAQQIRKQIAEEIFFFSKRENCAQSNIKKKNLNSSSLR